MERPLDSQDVRQSPGTAGRLSPLRHIEPGHAAVRRTLYMAAGIAMRFQSAAHRLALRLKARGKPFKAVATALMRKLVVLGSLIGIAT